MNQRELLAHGQLVHNTGLPPLELLQTIPVQ